MHGATMKFKCCSCLVKGADSISHTQWVGPCTQNSHDMLWWQLTDWSVQYGLVLLLHCTHTHVNTKKTARWNVCKMAVAVDIQEFSVFMNGIISLS